MRAPELGLIEPAAFAATTPAVVALESAAMRADGHPSLGDAVWRDLEHPRADSAGILRRDESGAPVTYAHVARGDNVAPAHWTLGIVVDPARADTDARHDVVTAALEHVATHGGGAVVLWIFGAQPTDDQLLARDGFEPTRELYEMRVPLPLAERPRLPDGVRLRPFVPGRDEDEWLSVNNRAFEHHPDQGGWVPETLARRMAEPWFDPSIFLLAVDDEGIAGFNWLKMHDAHGHDPRLGEIFVIGVDPRAQGTGLGRALAVAGLDLVHARGIDTGMLFCAADNQAGLGLYRALGFTVHRADRAYEHEVRPA